MRHRCHVTLNFLASGTRHSTRHTKYKRVIRSILALELYNIAYSFNIDILVKSIVNRILEMNLLLVIYIDLKLLYKCLIKLETI